VIISHHNISPQNDLTQKRKRIADSLDKTAKYLTNLSITRGAEIEQSLRKLILGFPIQNINYEAVLGVSKGKITSTSVVEDFKICEASDFPFWKGSLVGPVR